MEWRRKVYEMSDGIDILSKEHGFIGKSVELNVMCYGEVPKGISHRSYTAEKNFYWDNEVPVP